MAITSGFFNSSGGDRKYDARQMGEMFDGLIEDGVFMSIGDALKTVPSSGMTVAVGTGRAWFLHTWTKNDSDLLITVSEAESVLNRIDTIVLDVDNTEAKRTNDIFLVKGTPSSNPKRPSLVNTDDHKQIPLADILVPAGSSTLTATNITNLVGTSECPYVTGPLSIIQNDDILAAWQEEFDEWFDDVKGTLGSDTAGQLYNLIQQKVDKTSVLDTMDEVNLATEKGLVAGALALKELNGKMTEIGSQQSYSENGWSVSYRKIGANRLYYVALKTVSSIEAGGNQLEIATLPFKVAFSKYLNLVMHVSGTPVGYGYVHIVPTSTSGNTSVMYRHCTGYGNAVSMQVFGELVID